jgi:taurine dioxygenase
MQIPQIVPSGHACGAEVVGVDLSAPGPLTTEALRQALREHLAVVVRGRLLSDEYLLALGGIFGTPEMQGVSVLNQHSGDVRQEHLVVSNRMTLERPTGTRGRGDPLWQTELSYRMRPCSIALLHALEVPAAGGDIAFANQYLAYERLPEDLKARIEGRMLLHDESLLDDGRLRKGHDEVTDPRESTGAQHRIVRTHPESRRKALYLGRRRNAWIIGLPLEESERLLDALWEHATRPEWVWTHHWQAGDTLIWDNRCLIHRQALAGAGEDWLIHRVQIRGEVPR